MKVAEVNIGDYVKIKDGENADEVCCYVEDIYDDGTIVGIDAYDCCHYYADRNAAGGYTLNYSNKFEFERAVGNHVHELKKFLEVMEWTINRIEDNNLSAIEIAKKTADLVRNFEENFIECEKMSISLKKSAGLL